MHRILRTTPRRLASTLSPSGQNDYTHCVIGGGVVGLAVARQLAVRHPGTSTVLLERHEMVGTETSSRNSEVIHAGLYYPAGSLKTELCVRGAEMLYELCEKARIPFRRTGKLILAQTEPELETLNALYTHALDHSIPLRFLSAREVRAREPSVTARHGALESPRTGILDSHALMQHLHGAFEDAGGDVALCSPVTGVAPLASGYRIEVPGGAVTADVVVNAAGLGAVDVANMVLPAERQLTAYYCKGTYFSYTGRPLGVRTLLYPAPVKGHGGLGTHLTLDIGGRVRFGPDVEWVGAAEDLVPGVGRVKEAVAEIRRYLPGVREEDLVPDYCGVRPKIVGPEGGGVGGVDFVVRVEEGREGWVNLLGIESPGLTSSLAIAEKVERLLYG
ncbi:FAD dependent oxidoreductase [Morchella snyderi]|nr:FAD dependent oxidoreductase [Morchella snyderi]